MEWNIRQGGSRDRMKGIIESVRQHDPDLVCLLEFRQERILEISLGLANSGWKFVLSSQPPMRENGILVASKKPISVIAPAGGPPSIPHRWMEIAIEGSDLRILVVHVPTASNLEAKMDFWERLLDHGRVMMSRHDRAVIIGDLNTGLDIDAEGTGFIGAEKFRELLDLGWRDVWREYRHLSREYSWYSSKGNGFRLDHVLATPYIDRPVWAKYSHHERERGLSDHSVLIFDIAHKLNENGSVQGPLK